MTTQLPEMLAFGSRCTFFYEEPLRDFLRTKHLLPDDPYHWSCSALMRGYRGFWRIRARRLYLCHIGDCEAAFSMEALFPDIEGEVFAEWFSGTLHLPHGPPLKARPLGRVAVYVNHLLLIIESGVVVDARIDKPEKSPIAQSDLPVWLKR